jgi:hypothetical protein
MLIKHYGVFVATELEAVMRSTLCDRMYLAVFQMKVQEAVGFGNLAGPLLPLMTKRPETRPNL